MSDTKKTQTLPALMFGGSWWAIRPDAIPRLMETARTAVTQPLAFMDDEFDELDDEDTPEVSGPRVAVISLTGVLTPHGSLLSFLFGGGGSGVQGFRDRLARAVEDPEVAAIVLDIDSPGGSVGLVPEAAADVRAARAVKPIYAVANTMAASGAYYIASQVSPGNLFVTPSGDVGSIGVYYLHADYSRMNDRVGVEVTYIMSAGSPHKTDGNMDEPLSDSAREAWQKDADALYAKFVEAVAGGRGVSEDVVQENFGQGRVLLADDALAAGMVDGVATLQEVVEKSVVAAAQSVGANARHVRGRFAAHGRTRNGHVAVAAAASAETEPPADDEIETADAPPPTDAPADDVDVDGPETVTSPDGNTTADDEANDSAADAAAVAALLI